MKRMLNNFMSVASSPVRARQRWLLMALVIPLALSFFFPLWRIRMEAPQYPRGLHMDIYAYKLGGGNNGHDVTELNSLNHYIGMHRIERSTVPELGWIPFAFGALALLTLRVAVLGRVRDLVDLSVLISYVTLFFFARFVLMLYRYGHDLDPTAALKIKPFMPVIVGTKQVANFTTQSYPLAGTVLVGLYAAGIVFLTGWHFLRGARPSSGREPGAGDC
jgi:copper chaperone NosL